MSASTPDWAALAAQIKSIALEMGFCAVGIADVDLTEEWPRLQQWLESQYHGEMDYMARHGQMRVRPDELHPGTLRVISVALDYLPPDAGFAQTLKQPEKGYISRYAGGRDYHKLMRNRLKHLGQRIKEVLPELDFRPFVDSAPLLERPLARNAGLGWVGKHSLLLNKKAGSWFFLGELLVNLPLPVETRHDGDCGSCTACLTSCPTGAIVEPYIVDGRRCISYLTIELDGPIPEPLRAPMGNRIYGCDDCQLVCPWNRSAPLTKESDFHIRAALHQPDLLSLWGWDEATFLKHTEGSPIRRIGFRRWQRNLAVALGNAPADAAIVKALESGMGRVDSMVDEHIQWALAQQAAKLAAPVEPNRQQQRLIRIVEKGLPRDA
ncbi:tRNA epoxyqueuosine(34) reductase QueG [Ferrimonas balearica]|uniref:tRNA epoxyqueuosine(34) reductase QueG n=1 Tax=Ferrimonas balearica TaxID=44012 RepID=UPI001C9A13DF|nr:tRNA epoxyqueuosine(34) reductase QueG [Ferrimonas balearica]MBY5922890.1 tRNA epoxyqueuosine(34) reductase QueG [Ferrimonas balearica]MBY5997733.1 tRNA epoxyqueuosine(34) reductase QueG [Ferrimonas balearica]